MRLKALYTISELAALLGMSRWRARQLVRKAAIATMRQGDKELVPISELKERCPLLWDSLAAITEQSQKAACGDE